MKTNRIARRTAVSVAIIFCIPAIVNAEDRDVEWTLSSEAWAPSYESQIQGTGFRNAAGTTWAPGGAGATNSIKVEGNGKHVDMAWVTYNQGMAPSNACVDEFEIYYYEGGERKEEKSDPNCAL
ncbi:hypothetical protein [Corynebacterium sp. 21KM1197]|uniref:hypothetical protein n=1 Tax=Corynebacterium sp. 21KM1197 TaxID=2989734 RepID=UPI0029CA29EA|nr:hypothetical protein [Corynebacterium sp. 21KM1197]WPF69824.1 hypothetical protein OLW90_11550 [Corynebacterium sp. 21KM1197]